jgi:hypothetical protein
VHALRLVDVDLRIAHARNAVDGDLLNAIEVQVVGVELPHGGMKQ